jgi:hypothetical protein
MSRTRERVGPHVPRVLFCGPNQNINTRTIKPKVISRSARHMALLRSATPFEPWAINMSLLWSEAQSTTSTPNPLLPLANQTNLPLVSTVLVIEMLLLYSRH